MILYNGQTLTCQRMLFLDSRCAHIYKPETRSRVEERWAETLPLDGLLVDRWCHKMTRQAAQKAHTSLHHTTPALHTTLRTFWAAHQPPSPPTPSTTWERKAWSQPVQKQTQWRHVELVQINTTNTHCCLGPFNKYYTREGNVTWFIYDGIHLYSKKSGLHNGVIGLQHLVSREFSLLTSILKPIKAFKGTSVSFYYTQRLVQISQVILKRLYSTTKLHLFLILCRVPFTEYSLQGRVGILWRRVTRA